MATPSEHAASIIAGLAASEPELDTGVGTPIRKIIDTFAEALSEVSINNFLTNYQYDLDSREGADLDSFAAMFGFYRRQAVRATGTVLLQRTTASPESITIGQGSQAATDGAVPVIVQTAVPAVFPRGNTVLEVPVVAVLGGTSGNISAETVTRWLSGVEGITSVTNPTALTGGLDSESDEQFRERIRKTIFRNLAGTEDMYEGVALGNPDVSQAEVYGAYRRWTELIEISGGTGTSSIADRPWEDSFEGDLPTTIDPDPYSILLDRNVSWINVGDWVRVTDATGSQNDTNWEGIWRIRSIDISTTSRTTVSFIVEDGDGNLVTATENNGVATFKKINRISSVNDSEGYALGVSIDQNNIFSKTAYSIDTTLGAPTVTVLDSTAIPDGVYEFSFLYASQGSRNRAYRTTRIISDRIDVWADGTTVDEANTVSIVSSNRTFAVAPYNAGQFKRRDGSFPNPDNYILSLPLLPIVTVPGSISIGTLVLDLDTDYWIVDYVVPDETGSQISLSGIEINVASIPAPEVGPGWVAGGAYPVSITQASIPDYSAGMRIRVEGTNQPTINGNVYTLVENGANFELDGSPENLSVSGGSIYLYHPTSVDYSFNSVPISVQRDTEEWRLLGHDLLVHSAVDVPLNFYFAVLLRRGFTAASVQTQVDNAVASILSGVGIGGILQISDVLNAVGDVGGIDAVRMLNSADVSGAKVTAAVDNTDDSTITVDDTSFVSGLAVGGHVIVSQCDTTQVDAINGLWEIAALPAANQIDLAWAGNPIGFAADEYARATDWRYAVTRMSPDGSVPVSVYSARTYYPARHIDIQANSYERLVLNSVNLTVKAQSTWSNG